MHRAIVDEMVLLQAATVWFDFIETVVVTYAKSPPNGHHLFPPDFNCDDITLIKSPGVSDMDGRFGSKVGQFGPQM